ncbi:MAG: polysaccharide deacetylase family protein [Bacteroidetes bacterium]|nr:polysaccharide deacetylase family protein [Bacteroidota bacterium]
MSNKPFVFLTFDVEEFDMPLEYNQIISIDEQMQVGINGLNAIKPLLEKHFMQCTLFTTANFAQYFATDIKSLAHQHEIASHTFYHSKFDTKDLLLSRIELEKIIGKKVTGLRMPRLKKVAVQDVLNAGYAYDSSINPTYLPGRYNSLNLLKTIYNENGLTRVPTAVTPYFRIPLFWLAFKNVPYSLYLFWCKQCLKKYGYLSLYFHPWEFVDISKYRIPMYAKRYSKDVLLHRIYKLVDDLKNEAEFISINNFLLQNEALYNLVN